MSTVLDAWRDKVTAALCDREGFGGGPLLDVAGTLQLLNSAHVRERDEALVGGFWNGFLFDRVRGQPVPCRFCGPDGDGHLFWECTFRPLVEIRENPEFHDLMGMDKGHWPWCLLWHGWLPLRSGENGASPWAETAAQGAGNLLESALGTCSSRLLFDWNLLDEFDADDASLRLPNNPNDSIGVSLVLDEVSGASASGSGFYSHLPGASWSSRRWGHLDELGVGDSCRGF